MSSGKSINKIYFIPGLIFTFTVATIIYIVHYQTNGIVAGLTLNRVQTANRSLSNYLLELEDRVTMMAEIISGDEAVVSAMKRGDYESLKRYLLNFAFGMDFLSICDPDGIVLVRSDSDLTGDDISGYKAVLAALHTGVTSTSIETFTGNNNRLSIYAIAPIYDGGGIIGVVNCIYDMANNEYVDVFKERTGCEATIFLNNERISTTLTDESGVRVTGSKAYDFISDTVLGKQEEYIGNVELYGRMYGVCYSPLIVDDDTIGILFTGVEIQSTLENQRSMNLWIIFASVIGVTASVILMVISYIITRKYTSLSEKQLNQQILMANISRSFLADTDTDTLITDTLRMVGKFMNIPQVLLFWLDDDGYTLTCRNEWINPKLGLTSRIGGKMPLKEPMLSIIKNFRPGVGEDACLSSNDLFFKNAMSPYRVSFKSYITTPIFIKEEMCAVVDYSREDDGRNWDESEISLATVFASTLTGVFEREAMGRRTSIIENSPLMIFYADVSCNLVYANPAAATITGYTLPELKAGGFTLILDEKDVRSVREVFIPQTLQKGTIRHGIVLICKDGRRRIVEVTSCVIKGGMVAAMCMDLTEIRMMESELIKAKNNAEQASRAKSEFLSHMSHEMRTPMNAIIGMTTIAKNAADNEQKNYALNKVENASMHLLGIINDILDMSKIEVDKLELMYAEFDFRNLLQKAVSSVHFPMEEKKHLFSMNVDSNAPSFCIGDSQRLKQVITNLLSNAIKFTPEGGEISLNVSLASEKDGMCELRFEVTDNGIGISAEQKEKIFRMFEQGENSTNRKYGGTGLGLAITKHIVELMGGKISVESEHGKGSRFFFTVKLLHIDNSRPQSGSDEILTEKDNEFAGRQMLLVEDIEINREILIALLDETGLIIDTAENGIEALDKITMDPDAYDVVFMDMQMPEMDGLEATRRIRALESKLGEPLRRVPIIAMTANVFKDDIEKCLAAGMDDHIGKPLDADTVFEKLRKYL
jgi:PAS domain S-box-containing protein